MNRNPPIDTWIGTPQGRLFARCWHPPEAARREVGAAAGVARAPLVLFHDSLGCVELWREFPAALAQATGRRVIAYDRLGFGRSDAHPGQLARDFVGAEAAGGFAALRAQLGLEAFVAFGHSVGGAMAAHCAARHPGDCQALVTESAQACVEAHTLEGIRAAQAEFAQPGQLERLARYHGAKAPWVLAAWTDTWLSDAFRSWSLAADGVRIGCPLLVLHGALDEYGSPEQPAGIAALANAGAEVLLLPGCHHVPHREQAARVLAHVTAFLTRHVPGGAA